MTPELLSTLLITGGGLIALAVFFTFVPVGLWISSFASGVHVSIFTLIGMRLRRVVPSKIINPLIKAVKAGIGLNTNQLESHFLAGGNVDRVVNALIAAHRADIELSFERAAAIDLAGRNVLEAVQMSVNPKVIETPFIARVGEGVVSTIGSQHNHKHVLENPDMISRTVLTKGLDSGTAFEILSIDIADIDIGKNIGAVLQTDQAEADKKIAQAKAEERRAMAIAREQEMKSSVEEMRAKVVAAEAEVPLAMADALRNGKLGVMDYVNYLNVQADTQMRNAIGHPVESDRE
ncbi:UPF0365 family protein [Exiguobacterium sp. SH0S1]|uniref:flotillin-like FloA family protein n=1 Tax=Exiguobacterium sp. SH0S1 TaxID=2510949 RepID=UPI00103FA023|nr:flotillin-like FloA family protein [Exiguobacterium sp. SH0S1]TCI80708.1 UPF0365 family protein [Exiguobacterium sp. SH0S1]